MSSKHRSSLRNRVEYGAYLVARTAARMLGPRRLASLGATLGRVHLALDRRRRRVLDANLALVFPELAATARSELARSVARHFGRVALDTLRIQRLSLEELLQEVTLEGETHLEQALALGRGVFVLSAHIGLWEIVGLVVGPRIPEGLSVIQRPLDNPILEQEVVRLRQAFGNRLIGKERIGRTVIEQLRRGGAVGILIDQRALPEEGVLIPFLGHPAWTHSGLAKLVRATRAPVVPIFCLWRGPARYALEIGRPIVVDEIPSAETETVPLTALLSRVTEDVIRRYPEQWLWYHDRWREFRTGTLSETVPSP